MCTDRLTKEESEILPMHFLISNIHHHMKTYIQKCALENDVFGSIPDDHLLDELEA
jgi:hypothetical protein